MPINARNVCLARLIEAMDLNLPHNEIAWNNDNIQDLLKFSPPDSLSVKHEPATGDYEINLNFSITEVFPQIWKGEFLRANSGTVFYLCKHCGSLYSE